MKKIESLNLKYVGYQQPENEEEVDIEIAGLETIITTAQQRISILKQSLKLTKAIKNSTIKDESDAKTVTETNP